MINQSSNQKGMTLIEILVSLAIGSLLMAGIVQVFAALGNTNRLADGMSRLQESARIATDILARDIRLVGYKGCSDPSLINVEVIARDTNLTNLVDEGLFGVEVQANGWGAGTEPFEDIDDGGAEMALIGSDVIQVQHASTESINLTGNVDPVNSNVQINGNSLGFEQGDLVLISDCEFADLFRINNNPGNAGIVTLNHSMGSNTSNRLSNNYGTDAEVMQFVSNTYFVGDTGRDNLAGDPIHALYRVSTDGTVQEIVEGVENMQILYGQELPTGNMRYVAADDAALDFSDVTTVKIGILVTSNERVLEADDEYQYTLAGTTMARVGGVASDETFPNDQRLRRVFETSINLRNRNLSD